MIAAVIIMNNIINSKGTMVTVFCWANRDFEKELMRLSKEVELATSGQGGR